MTLKKLPGHARGLEHALQTHKTRIGGCSCSPWELLSTQALEEANGVGPFQSLPPSTDMPACLYPSQCLLSGPPSPRTHAPARPRAHPLACLPLPFWMLFRKWGTKQNACLRFLERAQFCCLQGGWALLQSLGLKVAVLCSPIEVSLNARRRTRRPRFRQIVVKPGQSWNLALFRAVVEQTCSSCISRGALQAR